MRMQTDERGFTLTETLVALFIMIAASTLLYRGFAGGLAATGKADGQQIALAVAKSRLAALGAEIPLAAGRYEGADGGVSWALDVTPYVGGVGGSDRDSEGQSQRLQAFWAKATVGWRDRGGRAHSLHLTTLKLRGKS